MADSTSRSGNFWSRLQAHPAFRAGAVYAGASWLILQASDVLGASTAVTRAIAVVLAVGFVGLVATVWLLAAARARREEGGVPPRRAAGRQWLVIALLFVILGTGLWLFAPRLLKGDVRPGADRIAVLPFRANTESSRPVADGMVDLLSAALDQVGSITTVPPRTVMNRWERAGGNPDDEGMRAIGRDVGAGSVLSGSIVQVGQQLQIQASLRSTETGEELAESSVSGNPDDVLRLVDELSVDLLRDVWRSREPVPQLRAGAIISSRPSALRAYLRGEQLYRGLAWDSAVPHFREAVTQDSTFALAALRLSESLGWMRGHGDPEALEYARLAVRHADRLPPRERSLVYATLLHEEGKAQALDSLRLYTIRYPDDPLGWYHLGDARFHSNWLRGWTDEQLFEPFEQVRRLDPSFTPAPFHPLEFSFGLHDRERAQFYLDWTEEVELQAFEGMQEAAFAVAFAGPDSSIAAAARLIGFESANVLGTVFGNAVDGRLMRNPAADIEWATRVLDSFESAATTPSQFRIAVQGRMQVLHRAGRPLAVLDTLRALRAAGIYQQPVEFMMAGQATGGLLPEPIVRQMAAGLRTATSPEHIVGGAIATLVLGSTGGMAVLDDLPVPPFPDTALVNEIDRIQTAAYGAWVMLVEGDTAAAIAQFDQVVNESGYSPLFTSIQLALFQYAKALALDPQRRSEGLHKLDHFLMSPVLGLAAYRAIAEAQEAAGNTAAAAEAYGHIVRLLADPEPHLVPFRDAARRALERLTGEGR